MPAPYVAGPTTGQDHNQTIQKLLQVERIPIRRMQKDNKKMKFKIQAWKEVHKRVKKLTDQSRRLYSFVGPFTMKRLVSSDPGAITGQASSGARQGAQNIEVVELASRHQIHSDKLEADKELPAAKFSIGVDEEKFSFKFKGGKVSALETLLREKGDKHYDVFKISVDGERVLLGMRSKVEGKKGGFSFEDPDGLLKQIGLVKFSNEKEKSQIVKFTSDTTKDYKRPGSESPENTENKTDTNSSDKTADKTEESTVVGKRKIILKGRGLSLSGPKAERIPFSIPGNARLLLRSGYYAPAPVKKDEKPAEKKEKTPEPVVAPKTQVVEVGPEIGVKVEDVELKGYKLNRSRLVPRDEKKKNTDVAAKDTTDPRDEETEEEKSFRYGLGVVWQEGGQEKTAELTWNVGAENDGDEAMGAPRDREIDLAKLTGGKAVSSLYFFNAGAGRAEFKKIKATWIGKDGKGALVAAQETAPARDAGLKINGIKVTRSSNSNIADIMEGASLNLHKVTKGPVEVRAETNADEIIKRIREWVGAYNELVKFCRENSKIGSADRLSKKDLDRNLGTDISDIRKNSGVFASDSTVRNLLFQLRTVTSMAYPTDKRFFNVLSDIGISTGAPGLNNFKDNRYGTLQIDEGKLRKALDKSPESVRELFANDTNEDTRIDNGVAFKLGQTLLPYSRRSQGMITVRIDLLNTRITDNKDKIFRKQQALKVYEDRLRSKFGRMEKMVGRNRRTGNFLRNKLGGYNN